MYPFTHSKNILNQEWYFWDYQSSMCHCAKLQPKPKLLALSSLFCLSRRSIFIWEERMITSASSTSSSGNKNLPQLIKISYDFPRFRFYNGAKWNLKKKDKIRNAVQSWLTNAWNMNKLSWNQSDKICFYCPE